MRHRIFHILGYVLYGLVAFIAFVYLMFPYDQLRQRLIERASQGNVELSMASLSPTLVPGLAMRHVQVAIRQANVPVEVLRLQSLRAWPRWRSLFSPAKSLAFSGQLYNGQISGDVNYIARDGITYWESRASFANLDVSRHALLQEMQQNQKLTVEGRLSGQTRTRLTTTGELEQSEIAFKMQPAVFTPGSASRLLVQKPLPCATLTGAATLTQREWQIESLTCRGDDLMIDLRGTFRPRTPWLASAPNLRIEMKSETAFQPDLDLISQWALKRPLGEDGVVKFSLRGRLASPLPGR
jgi:type II secretion system protein N